MACNVGLIPSFPSNKDKGVKLLVTQFCMKTLLPWRSRDFLLRGVPLGVLPHRRAVITTDASLTGWRTFLDDWSFRGTWKLNIQDIPISCTGPGLSQGSDTYTQSSGSNFNQLWEAQIDFYASRETTHCQEWYSPIDTYVGLLWPRCSQNLKNGQKDYCMLSPSSVDSSSYSKDQGGSLLSDNGGSMPWFQT